jgi:hypothetical protein
MRPPADAGPLVAAERSERARLAALRKHHPDDPDAAAESGRRLRAMRAERYLRSLLTTQPALDLSQRRALADVLLGRR